jgi:hypothetical protein
MTTGLLKTGAGFGATGAGILISIGDGAVGY